MGNIVVGALIVIAPFAAIFYMSTHGASGGCGGNCSGCGSFSSCHKPEKAEKKQEQIAPGDGSQVPALRDGS